MSISALQVAELRKLTNCGLMDCKRSLEETEGDIQKAVELLRTKGIVKAVKRAGRVAAEGQIKIKLNEAASQAVMLEINCETDFVARNIDFQRFVDSVADIALSNQTKTVEELMAVKVTQEKTLEELRQELVAKIGENISIRRLAYMETDGLLAAYNHGSRIGVLVDVQNGNAELAKDVAMHIAAANPTVIEPSDLSPELLASEKEIYEKQIAESGKPEAMRDKIVEGQLRKFAGSISLMEQPFVKNPSTSVRQLLDSHKATVTVFVRFELGEGIEKVKVNFAEEVMSQVQGK